MKFLLQVVTSVTYNPYKHYICYYVTTVTTKIAINAYRVKKKGCDSPLYTYILIAHNIYFHIIYINRDFFAVTW